MLSLTWRAKGRSHPPPGGPVPRAEPGRASSGRGRAVEDATQDVEDGAGPPPAAEESWDAPRTCPDQPGRQELPDAMCTRFFKARRTFFLSEILCGSPNSETVELLRIQHPRLTGGSYLHLFAQ